MKVKASADFSNCCHMLPFVAVCWWSAMLVKRSTNINIGKNSVHSISQTRAQELLYVKNSCGYPSIRRLNRCSYSLSVLVSMIVSGCFVTLEVSMRIDIRGNLAKVAIAAEVSVVAGRPCAVDGSNSANVVSAVNTSPQGDPKAANRHSSRRAGPGQITLDLAKNRL